MATRTSVRARWNDPQTGAEGRWEIDWSDTSFRLLAVRSVNPTSVRTALTASPVVEPGLVATVVAEPNSGTIETSIPANLQPRFGVTLTATGKTDGVRFAVLVPAGDDVQAGTVGA